MAGKKYGLDLGTMNMRIFQSGHGLVIYERDMIAIQRKKEVVAVGNDAYEMYERTPETIMVSRPMKDGVIADSNLMSRVTEALLKKCNCASGFMRNNSFYLAVPSDITEVEKRAYFDLIARSSYNTRNIFIVEKPIAAALGENIKINSPQASMIVDMGAGATEVSVIAGGGVVVSKRLNMGGFTINDTIRQLVKQQHQLMIGEKTAEFLKLELGRAIPGTHTSRTIYGRHVISGLPDHAEVSDHLVFDAMKNYMMAVVDTIRKIKDSIPPEFADNIWSTGIYFTGGTTLIPELEKVLAASLHLKVVFSSKPHESAVKGLSIMMEHPSEYKDQMFSLRDAAFE